MIPELFQNRSKKRAMTAEEAKEAVMELIVKHRSHWLALTRRIVSYHHGEDVLQIGIEQIIKILPTYPKNISSPSGFIATILSRRAVDELRRIQAEARALEKHGVVPETWTDPDVVEATEGYLRVRAVLDEVLPERQHEVYVLTHVGKFKSAEIAEMLGIKATSVRKDLSLAQAVLDDEEVRQRLREHLQD
jgi:RNA polymerase sigma factor (sigma-70 family)